MDPRTWFRDLTPYLLFLIFVSTLGPFLFGYHLTELNTPLDVITCKRKSLLGPDAVSSSTLPQCIPMTAEELGVVSSMFTLGGFLGALVAGTVSTSHGRMHAMRLAVPFSILGPIFAALAPNIATMAIGRFISGLGSGAAMVSVPIYISELSPPAEKGFFGAFTQVMVNVGIFLAQLLGYFLAFGQMWRIVLAAAGLVGVGQLVGLMFSDESPKWIAANVEGGGPKARKILRRVRGERFDIDGEFNSWGIAAGEDDEEQESLLNSPDQQHLPSNKSQSGQGHLGMLQALASPQTRKAVIAVIMVMLAQQLCGINSIIMYGVSLLSSLLSSSSALLNLAVSALNIIVTAACAPLVDKLGRKPCLLGSIFGMGISSLALAFSIGYNIKVLSAVAVILFVCSFAVGLGPVPFILASELAVHEAVGATQSWALASNWIATFVVAQFFPVVNKALGEGRVYFIFAAFAAGFFLLVLTFVPETKGKKSAEEVWGHESERRDD
ncbi:general substrate transporter [Eremomyces bilateralis CBS 781.70]|uniref:General substrate transporter n=1 Tax=Eremomyces bilateralis CBS 781.70 TaxID=1392243 RepID=A0A6G1GA62_9PEZI|nr:general substrate transporter [Eremomyces bilateralis CBS 781.70]KAF1814968.1 general substrate transporter [Eremomyces bilateralis CBS 781.70]